jgi:hypothetical protein
MHSPLGQDAFASLIVGSARPGGRVQTLQDAPDQATKVPYYSRWWHYPWRDQSALRLATVHQIP